MARMLECYVPYQDTPWIYMRQLLICILYVHSDGILGKFSESIIRNNQGLLWLLDILSSCGSLNSSIM